MRSKTMAELRGGRSHPGLNTKPGSLADSVKGIIFVVLAAIGFSAKSIFVKLAYVQQVDAVTLLTLRMGISLPLVLLIWGLKDKDTECIKLRITDGVAILALSLLGYYLANILDFWAAIYTRRTGTPHCFSISNARRNILLHRLWTWSAKSGSGSTCHMLCGGWPDPLSADRCQSSRDTLGLDSGVWKCGGVRRLPDRQLSTHRALGALSLHSIRHGSRLHSLSGSVCYDSPIFSARRFKRGLHHFGLHGSVLNSYSVAALNVGDSTDWTNSSSSDQQYRTGFNVDISRSCSGRNNERN